MNEDQDPFGSDQLGTLAAVAIVTLVVGVVVVWVFL